MLATSTASGTWTGVIKPTEQMASACFSQKCFQLPLWGWKARTKPDLAFASVDLDSCLLDRCMLKKFPKNQKIKKKSYRLVSLKISDV